ncbi:unnamed protein product [Urochloa humidicola]
MGSSAGASRARHVPRAAWGEAKPAGTGPVMDDGFNDVEPQVEHDWLEEGMDPNSSFLLKIKLLGNRRKARKDVKCYALDKVVDSDVTNHNDLIELIVECCPPGYLEVVHIQYYDEALKKFPGSEL